MQSVNIAIIFKMMMMMLEATIVEGTEPAKSAG
jgi:hypothetical protein